MEEGEGRPWVFWKEEQPYVLFSNNPDGRVAEYSNSSLSNLCFPFFIFLFLCPVARLVMMNVINL
jgi:hypothetical protein